MIRVGICCPDVQELSSMHGAVERLADEMSISNIGVMPFPGATALVEAAKADRGDYYDLVFCKVDDEDAMAAVREVRDLGCSAQIVLGSSSREYAAEAFSLNVKGYFHTPGNFEKFKQAMCLPLVHAAAAKQEMVCFKSNKGLDNVPVDDIMFIETAKRGTLVHLSSEDTIPMRSTLQAVYDRFSGDARFIKVGGSFVVNLDNVYSVGEGSVIFSNGEMIIAPVRLRKSLKEDFQAFRSKGVAAGA